MSRTACFSAVLLLSVCSAMAKDSYRRPAPVRLDRDGEKWAEKTLKKMTLEEKVGQMFMVRALAQFVNVDGPQYSQLRDDLRRYHLGGFLLSVPQDGPFLRRSEPYEAAMLTNQLQRDSELPLFFAADFERGLAMRLSGPTPFPAAMAFGAYRSASDAEAFGRISAQEARAIGVQWNFFPVADVNSNPANPIINTRAFGEDPEQVGALAAAYIRGAHEGGMLATAKHFPGHGDTDTDSHLGLARIGADLPRLERIELPPFRQAIEAGVDAVMVAHLTVPSLEPDPNLVATTSSRIVTGLLREKLGFQGLVVTDAMDMDGLMRLYSGPNPSGAAAVAAVKAGDDVLILPLDLDGAYHGLLEAVRGGQISRARIDASVIRILRAKAAVGLDKARLVDVDQLARDLGRPESLALGQRIADSAVTLVRDNGRLLPLKAAPGTSDSRNPYLRVEETQNRVVAVIFSDDVRTDRGRVVERELRARVPGANIFFVDPRSAGGMSEQILAAVAQAQAVIVPVLATPTSGKAVRTPSGELKNTISLVGDPAELMRRILDAAGPKTAVIALGNPYLAADFPQVQNYLCTFSGARVSELSAVKALFGEIPIRGRLPVTIPGVAQRGAGLDRPPQTLQGGLRHAHPIPLR